MQEELCQVVQVLQQSTPALKRLLPNETSPVIKPEARTTTLTIRSGKKPRVRQYAPKVSTGCNTCKIRRIKCDEAKPNCNRCARTGRKCDGYRLPESTKCNSLINVSKQISVSIIGTPAQLRSFDFFCSRTASQFSGICTLAFWDYLVPRAAHQEPAIKHAVIALGALHQKTEGHDSVTNDFALEQYILATRSIVGSLNGREKLKPDVALIACVLFACYELLQKQLGSALIHVESGTKILHEIVAFRGTSKSTWDSQTTSLVPMKTINLILSRLENQLMMTLGRQRLLTDTCMDDETTGYYHIVPPTFSSLDEARNSLEYLWTIFARNSTGLPTDIKDSKLLPLVMPSINILMQGLMVNIKQWSRAFESYLRRHSTTLDEAAQLTIHTLKMQWLISKLYLDLDYSQILFDETIWDRYKQDFEQVITHATFALKLLTNLSGPNKTFSNFSLDIGILYPLCIVANRCRDSVLRRKAIALIESSPRQEGILPVSVTALLAKRAMELEEEQLGEVATCEDVPNWARIAGIEMKHDFDSRSANVKYIRARCSTDAEWTWVDEKITW